MGKYPGVTAQSRRSHIPLCALTGAGQEGLTGENGICGYVGTGVGTRGGPGKKEAFLEGETHRDLEDLEAMLKKSFLVES